jgi:hypothetical protein
MACRVNHAHATTADIGAIERTRARIPQRKRLHASTRWGCNT